MGWLYWWIVIGGPLACAFAGALTSWLFTRRHYELRLDAVYEDGWLAGQRWYPPEADTAPAPPAVPPSAEAERPLRASMAASGPLLALPALSHEGRRHAGAQTAAEACADLAAAGLLRDRVNETRRNLGLPARA